MAGRYARRNAGDVQGKGFWRYGQDWIGGIIIKNYFVDSINGNNNNSGLSESLPFQTIGALPATQSGDVINLACNSCWREQLDIVSQNVVIQAYGEGERPILDCSNIIPGCSFTKTIEQANVYQADITPAWGPSGNDFVNVWEDNAILPKAASLAACNNTPGSCFWSGLSGTITLYIHPAGSINTNDKLYEYSHRSHGLNAWGYAQIIVNGIWTKKNLNKGGSLRLGRDSLALNCRASWGNSHNFFMRAGSVAENCLIDDAYHTASASLAVFNEGAPAGESVTFLGCTFKMSAVTMPNWSLVGGVNGHKNTAGNFGTVRLKDCVFENLHSAISGLNHASAIEIINPIFINCKYGLSNPAEPGPECAVLVIGGSWGSNISGQRFAVLGYATSSMIIDGVTINANATTGTGYIGATAPGSLTIQNCQFVANITTGLRAGIYTDQPGANLDLNNNSFINDWSYFYYFKPAADGMSWQSNYNNFGGTFKMYILGQIYSTLTTYQAATGQDAQ